VNAREVVEFLDGSGREALARFLSRQRWFAVRGQMPSEVSVLDWAALADEAALVLLLVAADGDRYYVPAAATSRATRAPLDPTAEIAAWNGHVVHDAHWAPEFGHHLLVGIATGRTVPAARGRFDCRTPGPWSGPEPSQCRGMAVQPLGAEQSNTSLRFNRRFILKSLRRPPVGINPDFEVTHFLATRTGFTHTPGLAGWVEYTDDRGASSMVSLLQPWVEHEGDGWSWTLGMLRTLMDTLEREPAPTGRDGVETRLRELAGDFAQEMRHLGTITGKLHVALGSSQDDPAFAPEPITADQVAAWAAALKAEASRTVSVIAERRSIWPPEAKPGLAAIVAAAPDLGDRTATLDILPSTEVHRIRCHGDYHLGQVLKAPGTFLVIDFEGEPARPLAQRRAKQPALRDVAGMLRSFAYAAQSVLRERPPAERSSLGPWLEGWERLVGEDFRRGYLAAVAESPTRLVPPGDQDVRAVTAVFELEKVLYELRYELAYRPDWVAIPLAGLSRIMTS
jgi:maltose alpha-D-glucosyltransferase/alpha-amylase